jgi:isocitrate/isopropylmalate dehydrogenase
MLLEWAGKAEAAKAVQRAVDGAISDGKLTPDLGGGSSTAEVRDAILKHLEKEL